MATQTLMAASSLGSLSDEKAPLSDPQQFPGLPAFPSDISIAPLHRISLCQLRTSPEESQRLFDSCKDLGFFYLDLRGDPDGEELFSEANQFFDLAPKLYDLGRNELQKYDYRDQGSYTGYKGFGSSVVDEKGNLDRNEFYNVRSSHNLNDTATDTR
jgi:isopenicillin N synthase-like dioxygenase